jgi:hypothetical protein
LAAFPFALFGFHIFRKTKDGFDALRLYYARNRGAVFFHTNHASSVFWRRVSKAQARPNSASIFETPKRLYFPGNGGIVSS